MAGAALRAAFHTRQEAALWPWLLAAGGGLTGAVLVREDGALFLLPFAAADYEKIDSMLGTEKDFASLCEAAHKKGIKIILDGVFSHTGDDSVYFNKQHRYGDGGAYNSKHSPYFKWYKFEHYPDKYASWWGFDTLPEVTEECEDYLEFITGENGIITKWLKLGADGWRLDVADELPDVFLDKVRLAVKKAKPNLPQEIHYGKEVLLCQKRK